MNKLLSALMAVVFASVSFTAIAADAPTGAPAAPATSVVSPVDKVAADKGHPVKQAATHKKHHAKKATVHKKHHKKAGAHKGHRAKKSDKQQAINAAQ